jgi:hypothetical protein
MKVFLNFYECLFIELPKTKRTYFGNKAWNKKESKNEIILPLRISICIKTSWPI